MIRQFAYISAELCKAGRENHANKFYNDRCKDDIHEKIISNLQTLIKQCDDFIEVYEFEVEQAKYRKKRAAEKAAYKITKGYDALDGSDSDDSGPGRVTRDKTEPVREQLVAAAAPTKDVKDQLSNKIDNFRSLPHKLLEKNSDYLQDMQKFNESRIDLENQITKALLAIGKIKESKSKTKSKRQKKNKQIDKQNRAIDTVKKQLIIEYGNIYEKYSKLGERLSQTQAAKQHKKAEAALKTKKREQLAKQQKIEEKAMKAKRKAQMKAQRKAQLEAQKKAEKALEDVLLAAASKDNKKGKKKKKKKKKEKKEKKA